MKRKVRCCVFLFFSTLLLAGWGKKSVELLNNKKLIDLNAAIGICLPGADASDNEVNTIPEKEPHGEAPGSNDETTSDTEENLGNKVENKPEEVAKTIIISVRDQQVTYDSAEWSDLTKLEAKIRRDYNDKTSFRLVDDFAEAHVYKQIISVLEKLEAELGLTYTRD